MADTAYFKKILITTRIRRKNGEPVPWINVGWQTGALETTNAELIKELTDLANSQKLGVQIIDKATFEELKKNSASQSLKPQQLMGRVTPTLEQLTTLQKSPKAQSEKPSKSAVADKPAAPRTEKPATATGVFPPDSK